MPILCEKACLAGLEEIGQEEAPGKADNPRIIEYQKSCDGLEGMYSDSDIAWCSAFANWCIQQAGGKGTRNPMARSWLHWGKKVETPKFGDIVVFWRGTDGYSGHVGFVLQNYTGFLKVLSGNSNNKVQISTYSKIRVLGYRRSLDG